MPKKSKKDKIISDTRRKIQAEKFISYNFVKPQSTAPAHSPAEAKTEAIVAPEKPGPSSQTKADLTDTHHLKKDLLKIFVFTIFALTTQVVIYYLHRS